MHGVQVYDANLGKAMSGIMQRNAKVWNGAGPEFNLAAANNSKTVREWDDAITRVSFGARPATVSSSLAHAMSDAHPSAVLAVARLLTLQRADMLHNTVINRGAGCLVNSGRRAIRWSYQSLN